ncbi:MAG: thiolase family protein [Acidimicrobiia bacterium]
MGEGPSVAVAGVASTDHRALHRARRDGTTFDAEALAASAYRDALADAGLSPAEVDGLIVGVTLEYERTAEVLGISPRWSGRELPGNAVIQAALAIEAGLAECVALVYATDQRSRRARYGGTGGAGAAANLVYRYYEPWGLTSQGALYALLARRYLALRGLTEADLAQVAVGQRLHARLNPRAVLTEPLDVEGYLAAPYLAEPLRKADYCLVTDGAVALVLTTVERARARGRHPVVAVAGYARAEDNAGSTSMRPRLLDLYQGAQQRAAGALWEMAGTGPDEVDCLQVYDSFSVHVPLALEGFGFCTPDRVGELLASGATHPGGRLPVNTSGGMLAESYLMGWNHQAEAVAQLRHAAGARQVPGCRQAAYVSSSQGKVNAVLYRRLA